MVYVSASKHIWGEVKKYTKKKITVGQWRKTEKKISIKLNCSSSVTWEKTTTTNTHVWMTDYMHVRNVWWNGEFPNPFRMKIDFMRIHFHSSLINTSLALLEIYAKLFKKKKKKIVLYREKMTSVKNQYFLFYKCTHFNAHRRKIFANEHSFEIISICWAQSNDWQFLYLSQEIRIDLSCGSDFSSPP